MGRSYVTPGVGRYYDKMACREQGGGKEEIDVLQTGFSDSAACPLTSSLFGKYLLSMVGLKLFGLT